MKKHTYHLLTLIPIVGAIVKAKSEPVELYGSLTLESDTGKEIRMIVSDYAKNHPDEQITRQLINRLVSNSKN
jgi:hypothetical protein